MGRKSFSLIWVIVATMVLSMSLLVSAEKITDPTSDVAHWRLSGTSGLWEYNVGDKPNIDIVEVSHTISGDKLTLTMRVAGVIESSEMASYWMYLNTSDIHYFVSWRNGQGFGFALSENSFQGFFNETQPEIQAQGDTLSGIFDLIEGDYSDVELWGYSIKYVTPGNLLDYWGDWAPNDYSPWWEESNEGTNEGGTNGNEEQGVDENNLNEETSSNEYTPPQDTPGFEVPLSLIAILSILLLLGKRRYNTI